MTKNISWLSKIQPRQRITNNPGLVTINDLLTCDNVKNVFNEALKDLPETEHLIIIHMNPDNEIRWHFTPESDLSKLNYMLDVLKSEILKPEDEE
jgi:hypothetical protein